MALVVGEPLSTSDRDTASPAALAWEFLRRSPAYQAAYAAHRNRQEGLGAATPPWGEGGDWGLVFRR